MMVDFVITLALFLVFDFAYGRHPDWRFAFVPFLLFLTFLLTFGLSLLLSRRTCAIAMSDRLFHSSSSFGFFLSPVAFRYSRPGIRGRPTSRA